MLDRLIPFHINDYVDADLFDWTRIEREGCTSTTLIRIPHDANFVISSWNIIRSEQRHFVLLNAENLVDELALYSYIVFENLFSRSVSEGQSNTLHRLWQIHINPIESGLRIISPIG